MIIFLYGQDSYRAREKMKEIVEHYKGIRKSGLNLGYFDCQAEKKDGESGFSIFTNLRNGFRQTSMFKEKKLQVVINPFSNSAFKEEFLKEAKKFLKSDDVILLYQDNKVDQREALFKFLKKYAKCQKFDFLSGQNLRNWVKEEIERYEAKIDPQAQDRLLNYVGSDLWQMSNEIKKLVSFRKNKIIRPEDISLLVKSKIETDIFKTIDALAEKDKKRALNLLHKHLSKGDSPLYLLAMINYQFRNLLIVKDFIEKRNSFNAILKKSGLHPFVVKKTFYQAREFSFQDLKKIYQKIFQADLDIKTGRIEPETALDLLIAGI